MRVTLNQARDIRKNYTSQNFSLKSINSTPTKFTPQLISFAGGKSNQILIFAAESKPYANVGGVSTVVDDYMGEKIDKVFPKHEKILVMPYYNGQRVYEENSGMQLKDVSPLTTEDGKFWYTNADLKATTLDKAVAGKNKWEIEKIATKQMTWSDGQEEIMLFKTKGKNHFFIYTQDTARMAKPYQDGSYMTSAIRQAGDGGEPYAKVAKALAEFKPELEQLGINPKHILLNDPQTGYFPEYISRRIQIGEPVFKDAKMSFVQHNLGPGYQGGSCFKNMFFNFATPQQVRAVLKDPEYFSALKRGKEDDYFSSFFKSVSEEEAQTLPKAAKKLIQNTEGQVVTSMIPIRYSLMDNLSAITPVSEEYANSALTKPKVALGLTPFLIRLDKKGRYRGILNGMNSPGINPTKINGLDFYKEPVDFEGDVVINGVKQKVKAHFDPFETYNPNWFVNNKDIDAIKKRINALKKSPQDASKITEAIDKISKLKSSANASLEEIDKLKAEIAKVGPEKEQAASSKKTANVKKATVKIKDEAKYKELLKKSNELNINVWEAIEKAKQKRFEIIEEKLLALKNNPKDANKIKAALDALNEVNVDVLQHIEMAKQRNMLNLFSRMQEGIPPQYAIGKFEADYDLIGRIDSKWIKKTQDYINGKGPKVNLFVSWGRADDQKGLDIVLNAFRKFMYDEKGSINPLAENSVLILGGQMDGKSVATEETIKMVLEAINSDPNLKGRVVFMNGFAPNSVLVGAADAAVFPSRFAPCELTDFEAMKYGATPMVTDLQGLAQKNFDPRSDRPDAERARATSYKTHANSFMDESDVLTRDAEYKRIYEKEKNLLTNEYKLATVKKADGSVGTYSSKEIKELVRGRLAKSPKIAEAYKKATDRLIAEDLAQAMIAKVQEKPAARAGMIYRAMHVACGWDENYTLHGADTTKSSTQLYSEWHLGKSVEPFRETLFDYSYMPKIQETGVPEASRRSRNLTSSGFDSLGGSKKFLNKKVLAIAAGIAFLGGLGYYFLKKKESPQKHASSYIA